MVCLALDRDINPQLVLTSPSILCNDFAIKLIEEPFIANSDDRNEWSVQ